MLSASTTARLRRPPALALILLCLSAGRASAQDSALGLEGRGGVTLPVGSFRNGPDQGGTIARAPTFGVRFVYRGASGWGPYVGFSQDRFDCAADGCPGDEYVSTTWDVGAQRTIWGLGWARLGLLFGRMERSFEASGEESVARTSSLGVGAEAGLGLVLPLPGRLSLSPGVRYGWLNNGFRDDGLHRLRWLSIDAGLVFSF